MVDGLQDAVLQPSQLESRNRLSGDTSLANELSSGHIADGFGSNVGFRAPVAASVQEPAQTVRIERPDLDTHPTGSTVPSDDWNSGSAAVMSGIGHLGSARAFPSPSKGHASTAVAGPLLGALRTVNQNPHQGLPHNTMQPHAPSSQNKDDPGDGCPGKMSHFDFPQPLPFYDPAVKV